VHEKSEKHYEPQRKEFVNVFGSQRLNPDTNERKTPRSSITPRAADGKDLNCLDFALDYGDKIKVPLRRNFSLAEWFRPRLVPFRNNLEAV